jgi:hypothetical protein
MGTNRYACVEPRNYVIFIQKNTITTRLLIIVLHPIIRITIEQ